MPKLYLVGWMLLALSTAAAARAATPAIRWGAPGSSMGELHSPFAVAVHQDRVYVSDFDNDRIQVFTRAGAFLFAWGSSGTADGQFRGPTGLAVDSRGSIIVADHYNRRIQRFTENGSFLTGWSAGEAAAPIGLAVDPEGRVYATDLDSGRIRVWSLEGQLLREWGGLKEPWGIAVDSRGNVWVAEHGRDRLAAFTATGQPIHSPDLSLIGPMGISIGPDGAMSISDLQGDQVVRFVPDGTASRASRTVPRGGDDTESPGSPLTGIALDATGLLWAADPERHQVARFSDAIPIPASAPPAPTSLRLAITTPNRGTIGMRVSVPARGLLAADIFSTSGRLVWSAPRSVVGAGEHLVTWNGRTSAGQPASSGVYFVRVRLDDGTHQMVHRGRVVLVR